MKQQSSPAFAFTRHGSTSAGFVAFDGHAAAKSARSFILSPAFLASTLVLGLILINILR